MRKGVNSRKWILLGGLFVVVVAAYLIFLHPVPSVVNRTESFFGIEVSIRARGRRAEEAIASAFIAVEHVFNTMSRFREGSDVWNINTSEPGRMVRVSESTFDLIRRSILTSEMTDGAFDITILPLMEVWRSARQESTLPPIATIEAARALVDWQGILLDTGEGKVGLQRAGMGIDLGGIAKGYAVDAAIATLKEYGINEAMVDIGGDLYLLGAPSGIPQEAEWWLIGIEDPRQEGEIFAHLDLRDEAIVTSGDYRWYFIIDGQRFHHIIDPYTGFPVERMQSVTVVAPNATLADGLSTAIFVLGAAEGIRLVEGLEGVDAVIVSEDEEGNRLISISSGIEGRVTFREDRHVALPPTEEPPHQDHLRAFLADTGLTFTAAIKDGFSYYELYDNEGRLQGFVLLGSEEGWAGPIYLFVQTDLAGIIKRVSVWRHEETPIFVIDLDAFLKTFTAHPAPAQLAWQTDLHGLTGATVTAEAIISAVRWTGTQAQEKGVFTPPGEE